MVQHVAVRIALCELRSCLAESFTLRADITSYLQCMLIFPQVQTESLRLHISIYVTNDEFKLRFIVKDCKDANSFILAAVVKTVCHVCHDSIAHAFISARLVFTALQLLLFIFTCHYLNVMFWTECQGLSQTVSSCIH